MMNKLKSTSGETIAEVLVASLVVVLGILLYATMVSSSFRIVTTAEDAMQNLYKTESAFEQNKEDEELGITQIAGKGYISSFDGIAKKDDGSLDVTITGTTEIKIYKR
ncbi:MAG: hypothetical protein IKE28_12300 [Solobacterium sp.]|nr:hypothetical protein [Solobacterium sp.]